MNIETHEVEIPGGSVVVRVHHGWKRVVLSREHLELARRILADPNTKPVKTRE